MDLTNETPLPTEIIRECLDDTWGLVVAITKATYEITGGRLVLSKEQIPVHRAPCADAPVGEVHYMTEPGVVDVTCIGDVHAPHGEPARLVDVCLRWGETTRRIRAFGRRTWVRNQAGNLVASEPDPFTILPMSWSQAFGGVHKVPAGLAPHTRMPMPSGEIGFAANRAGIGFYLDQHQAENAPLPHLEDPDRLIGACTDRPTPVCFAPCPYDCGLRALHIKVEENGTPRSTHEGDRMVFPRMLQNAPPALQAQDLKPGTRLILEGMTPDGPLTFALPPVTFVWAAHAGRWSNEISPEIVGLQLRASERRVSLLLRAHVIYPLIREQYRHARLIATGPEASRPSA